MSASTLSTSSSKKRERQHDHDVPSDAGAAAADESSGHSTTNFRNVSACNRCRNRKNRCDQKLPRCGGCEKANVKCVGFDPVSKRTIPRSYVYYLETRVNTLESLLQAHNVPIPAPSDDFSISDVIKPGTNVPFPAEHDDAKAMDSTAGPEDGPLDPALQEHADHEELQRLGESVGMVSVHGTSDPRHMRPTTGIPFAKVVLAAVRSSKPHTPSEKSSSKAPKLLRSATASGGGGSDSFFGLNTKPTTEPAPFPERSVGIKLVQLYFEHANPQIPILHRGEFMTLFDRVYATDAKKRRPRELYLLNIVFAIGSGIFMHSPTLEQEDATNDTSAQGEEAPDRKRPRLSTQQYQPEEYHSAAIVHLDSFLGSSPAAAGAGGGLEELQAVLLLAGLALLRPVAPGLWYIIGVAVRLAVDLGLHFEDVDPAADQHVLYRGTDDKAATSAGRRQWTRDLRRRLWWCVYSFDRLVSTCVGRPFGISDQVITTEFPSMLNDEYITTSGFLKAPQEIDLPSYKLVARHYFRLRLLQSEILQVLQHRQAEQARAEPARHDQREGFMRTDLPSAFLHGFDSFRDWRADIDRRLLKWKDSAPKESEIGVAFRPLFLELNYWQAVILLYRQSLAVPEPLAGELSPSTGEEVQSPGTASLEAKDDEEMVFVKVAQAGQTVLKIYRQLHRLGLVNYTFLATHHLFMSGISFLYAIWQSPFVRSQLSYDDVDFTVYIATSVLTDLIDKCPPAEACRDAFKRMSKATISMCLNTTGFGNASTLGSQPVHSPGSYFARLQPTTSQTTPVRGQVRKRMPMPQFDMNLKDLFSDDEIASKPMVHHPRVPQIRQPPAAGWTSYEPAPPPPPRASISIPAESPSYSSPQSNISAAFQPDQPSTTPQRPTNLPYQVSSNPTPPYQHQPQQAFTTDPLSQRQQQQQPPQPAMSADFPFDDSLDLDLDFLNGTFPDAGDPSQQQNFWGSGGSELDIGFGTGGGGAAGGFDGNGAWEANGGVDLFDGFFFGNNNSNGGGVY